MMKRLFLSSFGIMGLIAGCSPTVKVEAPDKPIVINMNMKIEHTVRMAVKRDLEKAEKDNPDVFD
jgi:hypothetical protein